LPDRKSAGRLPSAPISFAPDLQPAGQIGDVLKRLGVAGERMITVMIEPDDWLAKARQESRRLVNRGRA
jgi:hypothetical protein